MSQPSSPYTHYSPYTNTSITSSPYVQQHGFQTPNQPPQPPHPQPGLPPGPTSYHFRPPPPNRQLSYPPYTPSNLSHPSSPVVPSNGMGTPSIPSKRPAAPDLPGPSRQVDRKQSVDSTMQDEPSGKKKRVSLSCAQCELTLSFVSYTPMDAHNY